MNPAWIRYAPFSLTGLATVAAVGGVGLRVSSDLDLTDAGSETAARWGEQLWALGPIVVIPFAVIALLLVAAAVSVVAYVFAFWGFRLTRRGDGTLHTTRGLVSTNSITLERKRIRGARVHQPILMRIPHGAKVFGLASGSTRHPMLLPPAPESRAREVADVTLGRPGTVGATTVQHGPIAHRRRWTRGALSALLPLAAGGAAAAWLPGAWRVAATVAAVLLAVVAVVSAELRYRNLGHAIVGDALVIGECAVARSRTVLEFDGVVGWVTRESVFQRRSGVLTLIAATAVGARRYRITDLEPDAAAALAAAVLPRTVEPIRERTTRVISGESAGTT
ncbi:YdbT family protein [Tsukamurella soli]